MLQTTPPTFIGVSELRELWKVATYNDPCSPKSNLTFVNFLQMHSSWENNSEDIIEIPSITRQSIIIRERMPYTHHHRAICVATLNRTSIYLHFSIMGSLPTNIKCSCACICMPKPSCSHFSNLFLSSLLQLFYQFHFDEEWLSYYRI